ncbi:GTP-binding protein SAS1 [Sclerotinia borealis F-4128]|uniref:GTP-binding protein SAS1 n=1 Tax=Sclerotinia borealis (strain F-4128) TaxID=1432307 RepID=W9CU87_SCLBF|nr:GTP-binding protein SAS1 [Sclerotinia borealis F-4128]
MASDESIPTLKILLIGPSGAGKSALLIRYCDDQFDSESSTATIGVDFKLKTLSIHGSPYRLNLLDTAGQERFRTLSNSYYRGAHAVILVYDVTNRESFNSMGRWIEEAEGNAVEGCVFWVVGTKCDLGRGKRMVSVEEGRQLADGWRESRINVCGWGECSSKTREGVKAVFEGVVREVVKRPELLKGGQRKSGGVSSSSSTFTSGCLGDGSRSGQETLPLPQDALARLQSLTGS